MHFRTRSEAKDGPHRADVVCEMGMPDAILLDWNMPEMDGFDSCAALRKMPGGAAPKVVFCTTENEVSYIARAMDAGADEYIMKPFDQHLVRSKLEDIRRHLRRAPLAAGTRDALSSDGGMRKIAAARHSRRGAARRDSRRGGPAMSLAFARLRRLIGSLAEISLDADKLYFAQSRLEPIMRAHECRDLAALMRLIETREDEALLQQVVDAMTNNETSFFRDRVPFERLRQE